MAASEGDPVRDLCDEVTCPICLEHFKDPVTIVRCGHNFCRACLAVHCRGPERGASCPQCRGEFAPGNIIANRQLANVVAIAEKFTRAEAGEWELCEKHHRPLQLYCEDEDRLLCAACQKAKEHEGHRVTPLEDAREEKQEIISIVVKILRKGEQNVLATRSASEQEGKDLLNQIKAERAKATSLFKNFRHFLEVQEKQFLAQMEEVEEEVAEKRDSFMAIFFQELSLYESIIQKIKNSQQSEDELIQDVFKSLQREEGKNESPAVFQPALKWKIWDFCDINRTLEGIMKHFKDTLLSGLQPQKANITLDSDTAHPGLVLSQDCKTAQQCNETQEPPNNPERFDSLAIVLGREEFKEGQHFWEVTVGSGEEWAMGISRRNVKRKGIFPLIPEEGISMLGRWRGEYQFSTPPDPLPQFPDKKLERIRVCLNCTVGWVSFFDAEGGALLYSTTSFPGETLLPFFWLGSSSQLTLCP